MYHWCENKFFAGLHLRIIVSIWQYSRVVWLLINLAKRNKLYDDVYAMMFVMEKLGKINKCELIEITTCIEYSADWPILRRRPYWFRIFCSKISTTHWTDTNGSQYTSVIGVAPSQHNISYVVFEQYTSLVCGEHTPCIANRWIYDGDIIEYIIFKSNIYAQIYQISDISWLFLINRKKKKAFFSKILS